MSEPGNRQTGNADSGIPNRSSESPERTVPLVERRDVERQFLEFYGLNEQPFGVTPDLRFLYLGPQHRQALDTLSYGTDLNRGFLTLIARPGMGKTSILFQYLESLRDKSRTVFLFQTDGDSTELMRYLLAELGLDGRGMDLPEMRSVLSRVLLGEMEAGRRFVLVIDEAQNLDEKVLESIRMMSNFETPWMKLMHIVLAGQPQLADRLAKPSMAQLRQRVSFAIRIEPFTREEVELYIDHRLWVAGYNSSPLFSIGARALIAERSEGIPRVINNLCFCAMSYAWAMKRKTVSRETMTEVLNDLGPGPPIERIEKEILTSRLPEQTKPRIEQTSQPLSLPMKPPPTSGWLTMVAVVCIVGFALGLFTFEPDVERRIESSYNSVSTAVAHFLVPKAPPLPAPVPPPPIATPDNSMTIPNPGRTLDGKDVRAPQEDQGNSSSTHN